MGRPASIPDSFVKLSLPSSFRSISPGGTNLGRNEDDENSVLFFTVTM
jgi:hypothetical protein